MGGFLEGCFEIKKGGKGILQKNIIIYIPVYTEENSSFPKPNDDNWTQITHCVSLKNVKWKAIDWD